MPKTNIYNIAGETVGEIELNDSVFSIEPNKALLHTAVVTYLANQRQGTQSTLTRAEVRGGGRKPWRQKGTGRARQGSIRSPQWVHGGVVFAPKPRDYRLYMNKKAKRVALRSAFSSKFAEGELLVLDNFNLDEIKTRSVVKALKALNAGENALILTDTVNTNLVKSANNIQGVKTTIIDNVNVYDILKHGKFIVTVDAVNRLQEVFA